MTPGRVVRLAVLALLVVVLLDVAAFGHLTTLFDICFALVCIGAALAIRPGQFFWIGVLPPLLLLGVVLVLAVLHPVAVGEPQDGRAQALFTGLAHHSGALFAGYANALVVLAVRTRAARLRAESDLRRASPYAVPRPQREQQTAQHPAAV